MYVHLVHFLHLHLLLTENRCRGVNRLFLLSIQEVTISKLGPEAGYPD
jgi:hypothetical protein